jgi:hypothetical protein
MITHSVVLHTALLHVESQGVIPRKDARGRDLLRDTVLRAAARGLAEAEVVDCGYPVSLTRAGVSVLLRWSLLSPECCQCVLTSRRKTG